MVAISELLQGCLAQFVSLINSDALSDHIEEVPLQDWTDELGRLRLWAANIGAHQTRQSSLDYRLRDASHIQGQIVRLLEQFQELLTDLEDVLEEESDDEAQYDKFEDLGELESESSTTEIQEIHQGLAETITQLYQMSMIIRKPAQHDRLVGTKKLDSEPFEFWAKQHTSNKYPNADALVIDRISSAMARQRAILKYRERHHAKLSQGIDFESDGKSTILSETVVTDVFKEIPGQFNDMASDTGVSQTSYGGALLEGTGSDAPKIPPIPKKGTEKQPFECPYCFYIITVRDRRAWARHIFRDLMPYVCIFPGCSTPNKLYGGRRQWHHHIQQTHASISITDGTYDCSICKKCSLPAITFQRHVGQHLEELALFLLPRTDEDEDENELEDDNLSNVSLDDHSKEQSFEERNDMKNAATPASDSDPRNENPMEGLQNKDKHSTSSVGANLSDRESSGDLESNVENKSYPSRFDYRSLDYEESEESEDDLATNQKLFQSDMQHGIDGWIKQQNTKHLEHEPQNRDQTDARDSSESQLLRGEEDPYEDEIGDPLHRLESFKDKHSHEKELDRLVSRWRLGKDTIERDEEEAEREKLIREEKWKELARLKEEEEEREKLIPEEKLKELALLKEEEEEHEKLVQAIRDEDIRKAMEAEDQRKKGKEKEEQKEEEDEIKIETTRWIKVHRKHLLPETLEAYNLPWDWDEEETEYIIIKQWINEDFQERLFDHTRHLRQDKVEAQTSSSNTELEVAGRKKDKLYLIRKSNPSG
ncbi:hypothetical protein N7453_007100 [Penicillium expansum]|nr:hypothetical protein N7453_007100 [Penicillium expansum]